MADESRIQNIKTPYFTVAEQASDPGTPDAGHQRLFIDDSDHHLKKKNSSGTVTDLESGINTGWVLLTSSILSGDGTFSFSGISSAYRTLRLRLRLRSDVAATTDQMRLRVGNGSVDTGNNYGYAITRLGSTNANAQSLAASGIVEIIIPGNTATANVFAELEITINDYATTTYWRNMLIFGGHPDTSTYRMNMGMGVWKNAANAIDIVGITPTTGTNFKIGSAVWLYGMKDS